VAKRPLKLTLRIPPYETPRNAWRKRLHQVVLKRQRKSLVRYIEKDKLEVEIRLYIKGTGLTMHNVDNRLKDIMDALQGRAGGPMKRRSLQPIIPNDRQIYRVMDNGLPPWPSKGFGHLTIRKFGTWKSARLSQPKRSKIQ
jgi:hypothetical protein